MAAPAARTRVVVAETNMRGYRGLTLDAFGSLLDGGPGHVPASLVRRIREHRVAIERGALAGLWSDALRKHRESEPFVAYREVHRRAFRELFDRFGIRTEADDDVDETFAGYRRAKAFPEVAEAVADLQQEVPIAIVSNMDTKVLLEALQSNRLAFTFVVSSEEEQRYKPAASLFRRAVRYLGLPAQHVLHVGDSYEEDFVGAQSAGLAGIVIRRTKSSAKPKPSKEGAVVGDLWAVRDIIRKSWNAKADPHSA